MKLFTEPYLLAPDPSRSMCVCFLTSGPGSACVEYGSEPEQLCCRAECSASPVEGLYLPADGGWSVRPAENRPLAVFRQTAVIPVTPSAHIYYRAVTEGVPGETYDFTAAPAAGEDADFLLLSDLQNIRPCDVTVREAGRRKFDFILYSGDFVVWNYRAPEWFRLPETGDALTFFEVMQQRGDGVRLMQYRPFYPCPGNHDTDDYCATGYDRDACTSDAAWSWKIYMQLFGPYFPEADCGASGKRWYSADWGGVHVISLSVQRWSSWWADEPPGWPVRDDISAGSPQARWLESDLAGCRLPCRWAIMHWHMMNKGDDTQINFCPPRCENGRVFYDRDDCEEVLRPLFERYHLNGVSFGHSHVYERYSVNGVTYLEAAFHSRAYHPADRGLPLHHTGIAPLVEQLRRPCYCILSARGGKLRGVSRYADTGEIFDEFDT